MGRCASCRRRGRRPPSRWAACWRRCGAGSRVCGAARRRPRGRRVIGTSGARAPARLLPRDLRDPQLIRTTRRRTQPVAGPELQCCFLRGPSNPSSLIVRANASRLPGLQHHDFFESATAMRVHGCRTTRTTVSSTPDRSRSSRPPALILRDAIAPSSGTSHRSRAPRPKGGSQRYSGARPGPF